ncbi:MAG: hypothetical protein M1826_002093 [Phylliscum demangeonii]|nr:MAG: hypothetical protein M1826_002093 [Phylliscum demangeonii]
MANPPPNHPSKPSLPWRVGSLTVMSITSLISRSVLFGSCKTEVYGLEAFLRILDERKSTERRERGLLTVSNHISVYSGDSATPADAHLLCPDLVDPFSGPHLTYTTNGTDSFPAPSAYLSRRHSWIHIFPEGKVHQHPDKAMRYFKWGVARLILEADPIPRVVPMWIEGVNEVMDEARSAPRWVPRLGKRIRVVFGQEIDCNEVFGDLRRRWKELRSQEGVGNDSSQAEDGRETATVMEVGILSHRLKYGDEAVELRIECTKRIREQVLRVRRSMGWPDDDPKSGLADTWRLEGSKQEGLMKDGSRVRDV